jgi:flagellar biosynthetic protein FliO
MTLFLFQIAALPESSMQMSFGWLLLKTILALSLILALAVLFIKYLLPRLSLTRVGGAQGKIKVIERLPIDARRSLMIIEVENKKILIGVAEGGFTHIRDLDSKGE